MPPTFTFVMSDSGAFPDLQPDGRNRLDVRGGGRRRGAGVRARRPVPARRAALHVSPPGRASATCSKAACARRSRSRAPPGAGRWKSRGSRPAGPTPTARPSSTSRSSRSSSRTAESRAASQLVADLGAVAPAVAYHLSMMPLTVRVAGLGVARERVERVAVDLQLESCRRARVNVVSLPVDAGAGNGRAGDGRRGPGRRALPGAARARARRRVVVEPVERHALGVDEHLAELGGRRASPSRPAAVAAAVVGRRGRGRGARAVGRAVGARRLAAAPARGQGEGGDGERSRARGSGNDAWNPLGRSDQPADISSTDGAARRGSMNRCDRFAPYPRSDGRSAAGAGERRRCAGGLRRARARAVPLRAPIARRSRAGRRGRPGDLRPRVAGREPLRRRARLAAHLAVRDRAQRRHRPVPGARGAPGARGRRAARNEPIVLDDDVERVLVAWQVEEALQKLSDEHRDALVEVHYKARPVPRRRPRPRCAGRNGQEPRVLRAEGDAPRARRVGLVR